MKQRREQSKIFVVREQAMGRSDPVEMRHANPRLSSSTYDSAGIGEQGVFDYNRQEAFSIGLDGVATIAQVVNQRRGGSVNLFCIASIVVSLFFYFASKYLSSRTWVSAASRCSGVALFSATLAIASVLAMGLPGKFKCIPYFICLFPLVSLLLDLFPCLKCLKNPFSIGTRSQEEEEEDEEMRLPPANPAAILNSNQPRSTASLQMAVRPPTVMDVGDASAEVAEAEEEASGEYNCFSS